MSLSSPEFWQPQRIWEGGTCCILAGGPSLTPEIAKRARVARTLIVNSSILIAPWADALFFTDNSWRENHHEAVRQFPGLVFTSNRHSKEALPDKVKLINNATLRQFPRRGDHEVRQGRSSGHTAIGLAIALGARTIALLGYDMRVVDGREHHHAEYRGPRDLDLYAREFVPGFAGWNAAAIAAGAEVLNATPNSALAEFPFADLDEVLNCATS